MYSNVEPLFLHAFGLSNQMAETEVHSFRIFAGLTELA